MATYSQAEVSKLFAEELAKANGNPQAAETLRQQALAMGIPLAQIDVAQQAATAPTKSDGGNMPSMRPSSNLGLGFGSGSGYVETSGDAIKQAFTDLSASGMSEGQIMQKVAGMAADNGWTQDQLTAGAQAVNPNITKDQVGSYLKSNNPNITIGANGQIGKTSQQAAQAQTVTAGPAAQTQTMTAGPAQTATAQGYEAHNTDIASQYRNMGLSDPSGANARLLSGEVNNPYLDAQADNITKRLTKNLQENVLPGIGQGAMMAGGYGGSRQGIAQGKAIGDTNDNLANALTNMYSSANEAAQGRMAGAAANLSGIGAQVGIANTAGQNQAAQFGAAAQNQASQFNAGQGNQMSQFNAGQTNQGNQFNTGQANSMSQFNTGQANQGSQFNAGQTNSFNLGLMNNATQNKGLDNTYTLGQGSLDNQRTATGNAYTLGQGNLSLGNRAQDNSYELGKGNLALGNKTADNGYTVGMANVGVAGQNAANSAAANQNSYNLGLSQLDSTNQRFGQQYALDVMNSQYNWANGGVNAMNGMQQQPVSYFNNFAGNTNTMGGMGETGTNNQTLQGNPYLGAAGGYTMANKYLSGGW